MSTKLKNRTSGGLNTFDKIQRLLAENGAKKVMFDYAPDGTVETLAFAIELNGQLVGFRLPAMVDNVYRIIYGKHDKNASMDRYRAGWRAQAYKTAWANIRDWIDAQMALVQTRQVELAQVFLPYMVMKNNKTLFEQVITDPKFLLGNGE